MSRNILWMIGGCVAMNVLLLRTPVPDVFGQESPSPSPEELTQDIVEKEKTVEELTAKIHELREARAAKKQEAQQLTVSLDVLDDQILEARLQLDLTAVTIEETTLRIRQNREELRKIDEHLEHLRRQLLDILRSLDVVEQRSFMEVLFRHATLSDLLRERRATESLHDQVTTLLATTQDARRAREHRHEELTARQEELIQLQKLQDAQRSSLQEEEGRKNALLAKNVAQQARVSTLLSDAERARKEIQQEIFTLRNVGLRLSLREAEDMARYAGTLTGVRPALLLGVLKVESNIGANVGSGRYPDDIHPGHREAFLRVTEKLGLDPKTTPVSAKPKSYPGWGGALGPGQIMPGTWERVEAAVARLTGRATPSPFDLRDAFVATAVILQGAGAASGNEFEAVNRYFAGPNWQRFTWYGDRVLAVVKEYAARGL